MEKILSEILGQLKQVNTRLTTLEDGQKEVNTRLATLEDGQKEVNTRLTTLEDGQKEVNTRLITLEDGQKEVNTRLITLEDGQKEVNTRLATLEDGQNEIKVEVKEINRKTDIIFNQTAGLTEFQTDVNHHLNTINKDISFVCHKEVENEKDVFQIKKQLEIIK